MTQTDLAGEMLASDGVGGLYRLIADTIPHMVWTARPDGALDFINERVLQYTGLPAAAHLGWDWKAVIHPEDWEHCLAVWTRSLQSGERYEIEYRLRRVDGAYRWHHGAAVPLRGDDGRILHWFGTCSDIEDQIRSARQLEAMVEERTRKMRDAQSRLTAIIENEPECVKVLDGNGLLLEMNAAGLRMIEADSAEQVAGRCVYDLVAEEHRAAFRDLTERVCRGERGSLDFEIIGLKGARRWMETHAVPFHDAQNGSTRLLGITRDVTQRKLAELALRNSEQRFQQFMDHLPAMAWIRDPEFRYTYVNRTFARFLGVEPEALIGRSVAEFNGPEASEQIRGMDRKVLAEGKPLQYIDSVPSGRWLKVKFPLPGEGGTVNVAGIGLDISERSRLEEALSAVEQRFRFFMENAPTVAWIKDSELRYSYVSGPYEKQVSKTRLELEGRDDFEVWPEDVARAFRANDEEVIRSGRLVQAVESSTRPDGRSQKWLVIKFPLEDALGKTGVAGMGIDITERTEAEAKVRQYAEHIRELMNRVVTTQESERRRLADDLHDLIGQNLTALGIELGALRATLSPQGKSAAAPRLEAMAGLLNDTIESIRGVMTELRPPALAEFGLVPALREHARMIAERTGMKVSASVVGPIPRLSRDAELALFRIVQEALTNAAKHSGGTSVEIAVTARTDAVRVSVHDDGHGFADPVGARVAARGGWGLPAMRERAEALGGSLRVEFPGRGTRLVVEVPRTDGH